MGRRIAVVGPYPPHRGGIAQFNMRMADALEMQDGVEVVRVGFRRLYPRWLFPGSTEWESFYRRSQPEVLIKIDPYNPLSWGVTRRQIIEAGVDTLIVQWWHPFFAPFYKAVLPSGIRRVVVCHNVEAHDQVRFGGMLTKWFMQTADAVVVHSVEDAEKAALLFDGCEIVYGFHPVYDQYLAWDRGSSKARVTFGFKPEERVILFFGLIRPYKGLDDLLGVFPRLGGNSRLLIAGECYGDSERLREHIRATGREKDILWHDWFIEDDQVWRYFRAADLVVLPYRKATQSGVAQIALAFGCPMVLTRTGGLPELVEDGVTGCLAEPGDADSLAGAMERGLLLKAGGSFASEVAWMAGCFGWDRYVRQCLGLTSSGAGC